MSKTKLSSRRRRALRRHRLVRDASGEMVMPTGPITSATGRERTALAEVHELTRMLAAPWFAVTVAHKDHRRVIQVQARKRSTACIEAIDRYRSDANLPTTASVLVADVQTIDDPEAA